MWDLFFTLNEPQLAFLAGLLGMILTAITLVASVVTVQYRKYRTRELELAFKDELLDRGLSAADIDVLWSGKQTAYLTHFLDALKRCWLAVVKCAQAIVSATSRAFTAVARVFSEHRSRTFQRGLAFKRELLDRGLSVDEIQRLLAAPQPGFISWLSDVCASIFAATVAICQWLRGQVLALSHKLSTTYSSHWPQN